MLRALGRLVSVAPARLEQLAHPEDVIVRDRPVKRRVYQNVQGRLVLPRALKDVPSIAWGAWQISRLCAPYLGGEKKEGRCGVSETREANCAEQNGVTCPSLPGI